ncbi:hypothetical protein GCM10011512_19550 [Tersicoccus solisilvae]|uniref:Uncharacterized protein n=1 Tax=Tersicoccus solisilvae TaxID=1882339 RepID=A0ABQ1P797_9MICC|nr:hypothetical protein [Tersicoccus solisilvae]GGC92567.1 hypothetical protein GCM10011512_19550 [Tersicoccus solisilvae]
MSVPPSREPSPDQPRPDRPVPGPIDPGHVDPVAAARFRRLCRSSPWRWRTLRFRAALRAGAEPVEVLVRRPLALRVVSATGELLYAATSARPGTGSYATPARRSSWLMSPHLVTPMRDPDGLVRRRPEAAYGEAWSDDPRLASALDPAQLAGNAPAAAELPHAEPVTVHALREVAHEGRTALEAVVSPGHAYRVADPAAALLGPGRSTVRVDAATGVCVLVEPEDDDAGPSLWLRILGTDEYAGDDEFLGGPS